MFHLPKIIKTIIGFCLLTSCGLITWYWWSGQREVEKVDNAYLRADITSLAPKVSGYIVELLVEDNQQVEAGDILFRIDDRDYQARLMQAQANIAAVEATLVHLDAERNLQNAAIAQGTAQLASALATHKLEQLNFARYESLAQSQTASDAQFERARASFEQAEAGVASARAALDAATRRLDVLAAQTQSTQASLKQAQAARDLAQIDLDNTVVRAPLKGVVGNRQVRLGRFVTPGASLLDIVPLDKIWLVANVKENQLDSIRAGQKAKIWVDGYADIEITGTVDSLAPGTGAVFSLIPADNATGNFVRVTQRVPIKITLDDNPLLGRLVPGLSARVAIRTNLVGVHE